ncbi:hypothetical protein ACS0TY_011264 [Phlomoides rotata]
MLNRCQIQPSPDTVAELTLPLLHFDIPGFTSTLFSVFSSSISLALNTIFLK